MSYCDSPPTSPNNIVVLMKVFDASTQEHDLEWKFKDWWNADDECSDDDSVARNLTEGLFQSFRFFFFFYNGDCLLLSI